MPDLIPLQALWPELILLAGGCVVLLSGDADKNANGRRVTPWLTLVTLVLAILAVLLNRPAPDEAGEVIEGSGLVLGSMTSFLRIAALELGILLTLVNWSVSRDEECGEYLSMMLFSLTGLLLVAPADNLVLLFLALELVSIPTYIMVVLSRTNIRSVEAGTKYFYLGAMSAAVMAFGFSFLYGAAGTMSLSAGVPEIVAALEDPTSLRGGIATIGIVLAVGGLLFKLAAVPLHFYIADVYQGAASPVAGLLGFVPKIAGLVALTKLILLTGFWDLGHASIFWLLWLVAAFSMTVGNVLALRQTNIKRMLAYSGIAHAGYMIVGLLAGPFAGISGAGSILGDGAAAAMFYMFIYGIANLGAFAVLGLLRHRGAACETLRDVAGLLRREPALALLLALMMFTLMGFPPTPGFWGKLALFGSALSSTTSGILTDPQEGWMLALVIIAMLNSALAAAYYLRVVAAVLLYDNEEPARALPREAHNVGALLCGLLLLIFTFYPQVMMSAGRSAVRELHASPALVQSVELEQTAQPIPEPAEE